MASPEPVFDVYRPSLFELIATSQLQSLIPPSLHYLLRSATQRYPRYFLRIFNRFDEIYALLSLLVDGYYLRTYSSSFVEHFYSLKLSRVSRFAIPLAAKSTPDIVRETLRLRRRDVHLRLLALVLLPYLKRKLDSALDIQNARSLVQGNTFQRNDLPSDASFTDKIAYWHNRFVTHVYPPLHVAVGATTLLWNLLYLFDGTSSHSPLLWLAGLRIQRLSQEDWTAFTAAEAGQPSNSTAGIQSRPGEPTGLFSRNSLRRLGPASLRSLKLALPAAVFALKFLEWWHASNFASQLSRKRNEDLDLSPPQVSGAVTRVESGSRVSKDAGGEKAGSISSVRASPISASTSLPILTVPLPEAEQGALCPICSSQLVTPTACQTGYVFCYVCIFKWIEGEHERQIAFMQGGKDEAGWGDEEGDRSRTWESGKGRCAVTGRKVLGGSGGLRRIMG
ncbi:MAG: ubiquitin-protein ligase peroxin 12 [Vezdaea aestivalis]|nr:MAG: ubiquitin-protein ligase peroxin 12 [Vezdaea aestivalis]